VSDLICPGEKIPGKTITAVIVIPSSTNGRTLVMHEWLDKNSPDIPQTDTSRREAPWT
jgi:hypothetical protein